MISQTITFLPFAAPKRYIHETSEDEPDVVSYSIRLSSLAQWDMYVHLERKWTGYPMFPRVHVTIHLHSYNGSAI